MGFLSPTSHPSRLLGNELDSIILQLKNLFTARNITFSLIYNSRPIHKLQNFDNLNNYSLTTFDLTSHYTNISYRDTINAIITSSKPLNLQIPYRDFLLNLNNFINDRNFFISGDKTFQQIKGVAMGSYHSREIADLVLLKGELSFFFLSTTQLDFLFFVDTLTMDSCLLTMTT